MKLSELKRIIKQEIRNTLRENNEKIIDYSQSKNKILVGRKTNLINDMKQRYKYIEDGENVHFFDQNGLHFATLFDVNTPYQQLRHDGKLDDN